MLLRISLILAILAGIGVILVTHLQVRPHLQTMINERQDFKDRMQQQTKRAEKAERSLDDTRKQLATTSTKLTNTITELNTTRTKLEQTETARATLAKDLQTAREETRAAQQELSRWSLIGLNPEQVTAMVENLKKTQDSLAVMNEENKVLNNRLKTVVAELNILRGTNEVDQPLPAGLKGTVLVVDPKWEFVVLDIGRNKDVVERGVMLVHRNSKLVGKVRITRVLPDRSIANIMPGWKLTDIQEGDQVVY